jgi:hypothetical protein
MPTARRPPGVTSGAYLDLFDGTECPITSFHECKDCAMSSETKMLRLHLRDEGDFEEYNFGSAKIDKAYGSGWETVMKVDGSKTDFNYDSAYWTNDVGYNDGAKDDFDLDDNNQYVVFERGVREFCNLSIRMSVYATLNLGFA